MSWTVWDVETTTKVLAKRKASPFHPDNFVVISAYRKKDMARAVAEYYGETRPDPGWFGRVLAGTRLLVGFNIKFDILHAIQDPVNYELYMDWVADGGMLWDCQLAEYLLCGMTQENQMLSLDETAPRYGGHVKDNAIKALWDAGVETYDIDKDMLLNYAIGEDGGSKDKGDIGNTEAVFLGQLAAARARGQLQSIMLNMDSLLCTIEMEHNGMRVDKEAGLRIAEEIAQEIAQLRTQLDQYLPTDLPFEFNWGSPVQLSALVFGGQVKYQSRQPVLNDKGELTYYQTEELHYVLQDGTTMECSWWETCCNCAPDFAEDPNKARVTFKSGKNAGEFKTKKVKVQDIARGPKTRWEDTYYQLPGYTTPDPRWEGARPGVYSVSAEVIAQLANRDIPFLKLLGTLAALQKDLSTYYIITDPDTGEQKGLLTMVDGTGVIHHSINHTSVVTGRFSSSNPNLQNVPKEGKSIVKTLFISRWDQGCIIQSDFTALEIYVQANLTGDARLIADLEQGLDMHCLRAATVHGADYDYVLLASKDEKHPDHKKWKTLRTKAKQFSFQRAYGAGAAKIAESTGMTVDEVTELIAAEEKMYPQVVQYYERITAEIERNRRPTNRFVAHPAKPAISCQLGISTYTTPDGKVYSYMEETSPEWLLRQKGITASFSPTQIKNYVVQGTGGEWAKAAMALAIRCFYKRRNFGGLALLCNQVHDALYGDFEQSVYVQAAALLEACMLEASAYMAYLFKWDIKVPVPCETKHGLNMMEEHDMPAGFAIHVAEYRKAIRAEFMKGYVPGYEEK